MKPFYNKWKAFLMTEKDDDSENIAKVVITLQNGKVLLLKRSKSVEKFADNWDLPGGHLKIGEEMETGLNREVQEETGLNISEIYKKELYSEGEITYFLIKTEKDEDNIDIKLSDEHIDYVFSSIEELENYNISNIFLTAIKRAKGFAD